MILLPNDYILIAFKTTLVFYSFTQNVFKEKFKIENAHEEQINSIISLRDNMFASCSNDQTIKIWKADEPFNPEPIKVIEEHTDEIMSIMYLKDKDELVSAAKDFTVRV